MSFSSQNFNEIMPCIYSQFMEKEAKQWRQIYKVGVRLELIRVSFLTDSSHSNYLNTSSNMAARGLWMTHGRIFQLLKCFATFIISMIRERIKGSMVRTHTDSRSAVLL